MSAGIVRRIVRPGRRRGVDGARSARPADCAGAHPAAVDGPSPKRAGSRAMPSKNRDSSSSTEVSKNRGGRPSTGKNINLNIRVDTAARTRWQEAAKISGEIESAWVREALDAWASITEKANALGANPRTLVDEAIEDRDRVRAALAELRRATLSTTEQRVLRVLDPAEWARRFES